MGYHKIESLNKVSNVMMIALLVFLCLCSIAFSQQEKDVNKLIKDLKDENPDVRAEAARALGDIKDVRALNPLGSAIINDVSSLVQKEAKSAISKIKNVTALPDCIMLSYRIALIQTGGSFLKELLQNKLPYGFKLFEIKDETEVQQDRFFGILFLNYKYKQKKTQWMVRNVATYDQIEIKFVTKDKHFLTNWDHLSEEGYSRPGPSNRATDWEGELAMIKVPKLKIYSTGCKVSKVTVESLMDALKDEDWEVRRNALDTLGEIDDIKAVEPLIKLLTDKEERMRCENECRELFKKGHLRQGVTMEECIEVSCK